MGPDCAMTCKFNQSIILFSFHFWLFFYEKSDNHINQRNIRKKIRLQSCLFFFLSAELYFFDFFHQQTVIYFHFVYNNNIYNAKLQKRLRKKNYLWFFLYITLHANVLSIYLLYIKLKFMNEWEFFFKRRKSNNNYYY